MDPFTKEILQFGNHHVELSYACIFQGFCLDPRDGVFRHPEHHPWPAPFWKIQVCLPWYYILGVQTIGVTWLFCIYITKMFITNLLGWLCGVLNPATTTHLWFFFGSEIQTVWPKKPFTTFPTLCILRNIPQVLSYSNGVGPNEFCQRLIDSNLWLSPATPATNEFREKCNLRDGIFAVQDRFFLSFLLVRWDLRNPGWNESYIHPWDDLFHGFSLMILFLGCWSFKYVYIYI